MVDPVDVELCMYCLLGAVSCEDSRDELTLTAIALTRDLADTGCHDAAVELLEAATRDAVTRLDASDLDADSFARALQCLASLREQIDWEVRPTPGGERSRSGLRR